MRNDRELQLTRRWTVYDNIFPPNLDEKIFERQLRNFNVHFSLRSLPFSSLVAFLKAATSSSSSNLTGKAYL